MYQVSDLFATPPLTPLPQVTRQITKHNFLVMDVKDIPRIIKEAFYLARTGRPGGSIAALGRECWVAGRCLDKRGRRQGLGVVGEMSRIGGLGRRRESQQGCRGRASRAVGLAGWLASWLGGVTSQRTSPSPPMPALATAHVSARHS